MSGFFKENKADIVFFSGTGGTRCAADALATQLTDSGVTVSRHELSIAVRTKPLCANMLILLFPVYAMNAPKPVFDFIREADPAVGTPAAVLSVSAGGEVTPNKACRYRVIRALEKRGFDVVYEQMLVMPSNFWIPTPKEAAVQLVRVLPNRTGHIVRDLLFGVRRRTKPGALDRCCSWIGRVEELGAWRIGSATKVSSGCNGCGICQNNCPVGNISIVDGRHVFGRKCVLCLKCFYACPQRALEPGRFRFIIIEGGFNISRFLQQASMMTSDARPDLPDNFVWNGVNKYLNDKP
ncbi:EFR1 family ferrodoxin [Oscillospiraceae bacterium CM]|nr:EFR1 family ferrodoxin [Oscillospiraceae bacterium CM]